MDAFIELCTIVAFSGWILFRLGRMAWRLLPGH